MIDEGETGFLVPPRDPAAFADALARAASSVELMGRMGAAGRERVQNLFAVESMVSRTEALYRELLDRDAQVAA